jgi:hypothetical protein
VHEKQKTKRREDDRTKQRDVVKNARQKAEDAERAVADLESRITAITAELADPELYTTDDGKQKAIRSGAELDRLKKQLDRAIELWTEATEAAEATGAAG